MKKINDELLQKLAQFNQATLNLQKKNKIEQEMKVKLENEIQKKVNVSQENRLLIKKFIQAENKLANMSISILELQLKSENFQ